MTQVVSSGPAQLATPVVTREIASSRSTVLNMFESFREILDEQNDRYERLVKLSRDLTIQSKRIIFLLHRVVASPPLASTHPTSLSVPPAPATDSESPGDTSLSPAVLKPEDTVIPARAAELDAARQARQKFEGLKPIFSKIFAELKGQEPERFDRAISPGMQEFLESLSFTHYLEHGTLISYPEGIILSREDYLLGISDLSGELMRYAISSASTAGGKRSKVAEVCHFVRVCSADWEPLTPYVRGLGKKQQVTNESLKKIEKAAYAIAIRGAEYPDAELRGVLLEPGGGPGKGDNGKRSRGREAEDMDEDGDDF